MREDKDLITFVIPGDMHLTKPGLKNHQAASRAVDEVNQLIAPISSSSSGTTCRTRPTSSLSYSTSCAVG